MATVLRRPGLVYARKGGVHGQILVWDRLRTAPASAAAAGDVYVPVFRRRRR